jgi:hypothetical protein
MDRLTAIGRWFKAHRRQVLVHSLILSGFLVYCLFLAGPLFDRFEAIPGEAKLVHLQLPAETDNVHYDLEKLLVSNNALEIHGWAFMEGRSAESAENHQTFIVLASDKTSYIFDTSVVFSNPITEQYGGADLNLDWSGFTTTIPMREIEKGDYVIGLYISMGDITALQYSSKVIVKSKDGVKQTELPSRLP